MKSKSFFGLALVALALGFSLGLAYAWVVSPIRYVDANPEALRADFKDQFRSVIAAAYASTGDLERARARLALLGDPDPAQALTAQSQRMLAAGEPLDSVRQVALLASILQGQQAASSLPAPSLTITVQPTQTAAGDSPTPGVGTSTPDDPTPEETQPEIPFPGMTATLRPTRTPTPTLGAPFQLVSQETICEPGLAEGLLQITVMNAKRKPIPGAEIIVAWKDGEEHFFTGLKPELGHGYADYIMEPALTYSVRMADGSTPASDLSAPLCETSDGSEYYGGLELIFQQP